MGVIAESGCVKWGDKSAGVIHQYCGWAGKVENCQVGVYLGYVAPPGGAFLDGRLYLLEANTPVVGLPETEWERWCFRVGEKGLIGYEWQALRVMLANDTVGEKPTCSFWLSKAPIDRPLAELAAVALARHPIEH